ncbi:hypothetical protein CNMCM8927_004978 [Aspergillus lentulus]|uniref:STEEP1 domain-containing protein n=1 Tax=Aspergillus lentulus TaxID=293939 RepID=A0AAN5YWY5_ASPLE|nr:hypothetical protein CNMCM8060_003351 [Aspergillus lentulus]KAF4197540.1 hypothetical protein CNMCM8694_002442 [Aspergillus lentulus]KAF4209775.1 hypothetical protein CNMCM8927_004978 [Aspergillus lentulus]
MSTTDPSASPSRSPAPPQQDDQHQEQQQQQQRLKVHTHHCRFCNHLLLATTRTIATLPRRKAPAQDNALILPLPHADEDEDDDDDEEPDATTSPEPNRTEQTESEGQDDRQRRKQKQKHYTILLSTTLPDRKATLIRREDGFEKRRFLRCGRCRVVVGYFLDAVHFPVAHGKGEDVVEGEGADQEPRVVYLLPGALMETEIMGDEEKMQAMDREWSEWIAQ